MILWFVIASFFVSLLLGMLLIPKILLISYKKRLFDIPDARKVHTTPIPRLGGFSFLPVIIITMGVITGLRYCLDCPLLNISVEHTLNQFLFFASSAMLLYLVGIQDDLIGVSYRYKFLVQVLAASLLILSDTWINSLGGIFGIYDLPPVLGILFTIFVVVYITNAINLIDGIDGLASGLCCISLFALGLMHIFREQYIYAQLAFATLGVLVPFWCYNVFGNAQRGHKIFMGDAGSLMLGYVLSFLIIHLSIVDPRFPGGGNEDMIIAFSTLIVPLFDVVRVVIHRLRCHKNPFLPDKNHFHHKLLRAGLSPHATMLAILVIALFFVGLNVVLVTRINVTLLLFLNIILWTLMHLHINYLTAKEKQRKAQLAAAAQAGEKRG